MEKTFVLALIGAHFMMAIGLPEISMDKAISKFDWHRQRDSSDSTIFKCIYQPGYFDDDFTYIGLFKDEACISACTEQKKIDPRINGAIRKAVASVGGCWCAKNTQDIIDNADFKSCVLETDGDSSSIPLNVDHVMAGQLIHTFAYLPKAYTITFSLKLTRSTIDWTSVLHFTTSGNVGDYGDRIPAIFFNDRRLRISSDINTISNYVDEHNFPLNKWRDIRIENTRIGSEYWYIVYLDGKRIKMEENKNPREYKNVKVYCSDPWHPPFKGEIRHINVTLFENDGSTSDSSPITLNVDHVKADQVIHTFAYLPKTYTVTFSLKLIKSFSGWRSVLHFTTGGNVGQYGNRIPAVIFNGQTLYISSDVNRIDNYVKEAFPLDKWVDVKIMYTQVDSEYWYSVYVDGRRIKMEKNTTPRKYQNVKVYCSDPWDHPPFQGEIRNLEVTLLEDVGSSSRKDPRSSFRKYHPRSSFRKDHLRSIFRKDHPRSTFHKDHPLVL